MTGFFGTQTVTGDQVRKKIASICAGSRKKNKLPFPKYAEAILSHRYQQIRRDQNPQRLVSFQRVFFCHLSALNSFSP